jgi:hypothetical protein
VQIGSFYCTDNFHFLKTIYTDVFCKVKCFLFFVVAVVAGFPNKYWVECSESVECFDVVELSGEVECFVAVECFDVVELSGEVECFGVVEWSEAVECIVEVPNVAVVSGPR